jgi:hypothetical protein
MTDCKQCTAGWKHVATEWCGFTAAQNCREESRMDFQVQGYRYRRVNLGIWLKCPVWQHCQGSNQLIPHADGGDMCKSIGLWCREKLAGTVKKYSHFLRGGQYWGFELRALHLIGKCSTIWTSTFYFSYFSDRVLHCLPGASLGQGSSYLCLLPIWDYKHEPPYLACSLK